MTRVEHHLRTDADVRSACQNGLMSPTSERRQRMVTLDSWLRTARVGDVGVGTSAEAVLSLLGETEWTGPRGLNPIPGYWLYGEVELGFSADAKVEYIQMDTCRTEGSKAQLCVDLEGLSPRATLGDVQKWLERHELNYLFQRDFSGATLTVGSTDLIFGYEHGGRLELQTISTSECSRAREARRVR